MDTLSVHIAAFIDWSTATHLRVRLAEMISNKLCWQSQRWIDGVNELRMARRIPAVDSKRMCCTKRSKKFLQTDTCLL